MFAAKSKTKTGSSSFAVFMSNSPCKRQKTFAKLSNASTAFTPTGVPFTEVYAARSKSRRHLFSVRSRNPHPAFGHPLPEGEGPDPEAEALSLWERVAEGRVRVRKPSFQHIDRETG